MIKYRGTLGTAWDADPAIMRVESQTSAGTCGKDASPQLFKDDMGAFWYGSLGQEPRPLSLSAHLKYLSVGDIVKVSPRKGAIRTIYRCASRFNVVFATERCNSYCIMCSQPPRDVNDDHLVDEYLAAIALMSIEPAAIGISGGEPTLLGKRFLQILSKCKACIPQASVHVLTNGRKCSYLSFSKEIAEIAHPDIMLGIPLYSDIPSKHDYVVQAIGAFEQTTRGLLNLARCQVPVEIRVVLHAGTVRRLPELGAFIARNLPFVKQVAFMGLEQMGFVKMNMAGLWIDPMDYQGELTAAIEELSGTRIRPLIYNHQLCTLARPLWKYSVSAISDWKKRIHRQLRRVFGETEVWRILHVICAPS